MSQLVGVDDDPEIQLLIETIFSLDARFAVASIVATAEDAVELARTTRPGIIVLDHSLPGMLTGIEAAPRLKRVAPRAKIILFTAHAELRNPAIDERAIDAFLLKTDSIRLLSLAQSLTGLDPPTKKTGFRLPAGSAG